MEVNGQLRIPVALSQKKNLGGSEGQSGSVEKRKISAPEWESNPDYLDTMLVILKCTVSFPKYIRYIFVTSWCDYCIMFSVDTSHFCMCNQWRSGPINVLCIANNCSRVSPVRFTEQVILRVTEGCSVRYSAGTVAILTGGFHVFPHSFQEWYGQYRFLPNP